MDATVGNSKVYYTPKAGFVGIDTFTYFIEDDSGGRIAGIATVDVQERGSDRSTATARVVVDGVNDAPSIAGLNSTTISDKEIINPFEGVTVTDVDRQGQELLTLSVSLDDPSRGFFYDSSGLFVRNGNVWTLASPMTPSAATAALRNLQFQPTPDLRVNATSPEAVRLTLIADDGRLQTSDDGTELTVVHPPRTKILPLDEVGGEDSELGAAFGESMAIDGDLMAVGSPLRDASGGDSGAVYLYRRDRVDGIDTWNQVKIVTPDDPSSGDLFGISVALHGDTLVVGSPYDDVGIESNAGSAYIFRCDEGGVGNWGQVKKVVVEPVPPEAPNLPLEDDLFGSKVAIDGDTILISAPFADRVRGDGGMVRVYSRNQGGAGNWGFLQELVQTEPIDYDQTKDFFGGSIAIDGDSIIVGSYGSNRSNTPPTDWDFGVAYIFDRTGPPAAPWVQAKKLSRFMDPRARMDDNFGFAVDIEEDTVIVGAVNFDADTTIANSGAVFLYERNIGGTGNWGELRELLAPVLAENQRLGYSVALQNGIALAGADSVLDPDSAAGFVLCMVRDLGTDNWRFADTLFPPDLVATPGFGLSVAISASTAAVGAPLDSDNPSNVADAGAVYVSQLLLHEPPVPADPFGDLLAVWQDDNFPPGTDSLSMSLTANPDKDPYINALELVMGTDPTVNDPAGLIYVGPSPAGGRALYYPRDKAYPPEFVHILHSPGMDIWNLAATVEVLDGDLGSADLIRVDFGPGTINHAKFQIGPR